MFSTLYYCLLPLVSVSVWCSQHIWRNYIENRSFSHIYLTTMFDYDDYDVWPKFHMCEESINIVLFYGSADRKVNKSGKFWSHFNHEPSNKRADTLICPTTMCRNLINFLYKPSHVILGYVEVGPVANAREGSMQEHNWARVSFDWSPPPCVW